MAQDINVAVMFYQDLNDPEDPNVKAGIPGIWPGPTIELGSGTTLPRGPWTLMTSTQLTLYKQQNQPIFDAWYLPLKKKQEEKEQQIQQAKYSIDASKIVFHELNSILKQFEVPVSSRFLLDICAYLNFLRCGLPDHASEYISQFQDSQSLLDQPNDPNDPSSDSIRNFLINLF